MKTASRYASSLGAELAIIHKRRTSGSEIVCEEVIGSVEGRNIVMVDDMISTGGTLTGAARLLKQRGAGAIIAGATHGVFAEPSIARIQDSPIDELFVTDTVPLSAAAAGLKNLKVLTVAPLIGEAMRRIHSNESISMMFQQFGQL
jgi:ribose-phosphate pyrophosphokinase